MQRDRFDIMVMSKSTQDQIASYLVKVVLGLRDKENVDQSVRLLGSGTAISHVILVAEIIRARIKNVSSIVQFENMQREDAEKQRTYDIPAIRIKLTLKPSEEEILQPGYQAPNEVSEDKHVELFDYVMLYAKNLYFWSGGRNNARKGRSSSRDRRNEHQNQRDNNRDHNREDNQRNDHGQQRQPRPRQRDDPDRSNNWNKDRAEFQNQQSGNIKTRGNNRNTRENNRDHKVEQEQQPQTEQRQQNIRRGEQRTRGGQRKVD